MKTKSLSKKIVAFTIVAVFIIFFILMAFVSFIVNQIMFTTTDEQLTTTARLNAAEMGGFLDSFLEAATATASQMEAVDPRLRGAVAHAFGETTAADNESALSAWVELVEGEMYGGLGASEELAETFRVPSAYRGFEDVYYVRENGMVVNDTTYDDEYLSYAYFQEAQARNEPYITAPYLDEFTNTILLSVICPVQDENGGFLGLVGIDFDQKSMENIKIPPNSYKTSFSYLVADNGVIVTHSTDPSAIGKTEDSLGKQTDQIMMRSPVPIGRDGQEWTAVSGVEREEIAQNTRLATASANIGGLFLQAILGFLLYRKLRKYLSPVKSIADNARLLAQGDLNVAIDYASDDELGQLCSDFTQMAAALRSYVEDISQVLTGLAANDLTVSAQVQYLGDFAAIRQSLQRITDGMTHSVTQIAVSSQQVTRGTAQMAVSAQELAQSATQQAASVEELLGQVDRVAALAALTTDKAETAKSLSGEMEESLGAGNLQMEQLLRAIEDLNRQSDQIANIIGVIDSIAFQTNILALNAAVEAARAGAAGKGFAVVADEVRNLAGKSAEAAKNTSAMIQSSLHAIKQSVELAMGTARTLSKAAQGTQATQQNMQMILEGAQEQAQALAMIQTEVQQLSDVAMNNSATSEESAAIAKELNQQGENLTQLVDSYKVHKQICKQQAKTGDRAAQRP